MSRNKKTGLALLILLGLGGLAWAFLPAGPDPQLVKVQQLQEQLFNPDSKISDADRRKAFGELRQEAEKLTPEQRGELMRENPMAKRMRESVVAYFDLPEKDRKAALDKEIDRMEKFRKEMEKRRAAGGGPPGFGPPGGGPPSGGPPGGGPPGGPRGNMSEADRTNFRKRMLDDTSPQERAMFSEYFRDMGQRRRERGLPDFGPPGGR